MGRPHSSGWRINLTLFVLVCAFGASAFLVWQRRAAGPVVATVPGYLPPHGSRVPYVLNPERATLILADTRETIQLPSQYSGEIEITEFPPSRAAFRFSSSEAYQPGGRCWNVAAAREVPLPEDIGEDWRPSESGTRILAMALADGKAGGIRPLGLGGQGL